MAVAWSQRTYKDLVDLEMMVRLRQDDLPEWCKCKILAIVSTGLKVMPVDKDSVFLIPLIDAVSDVRIIGAFTAYERDQEEYDGECRFDFVCIN